MSSDNLSSRELQARHYWRVMQDGLVNSTVNEFHDEIDTLGKLADSPTLRAICDRTAGRFDGNFRIRAARVR